MGFFDKVKDVSENLGNKAQEAIDSQIEAKELAKLAVQEKKELQNELATVFQSTKFLGDLQLDTENELFKVKHARAGIKQKNGAMVKTGKALAAVYTMGASVVIEKTMMQPDDKIFSYDELISYELIEDESQLTKGGLGSAVVGGVLLGGVGAMVGGITGKRKTKKVVESLYLKINLNDMDFPCVMVPYITKSTKTKSNDYVNAFNTAQESISCLDIILKEQENANNAQNNIHAEVDPLAQIKQLKELLDIGAISEEEFENKKKELLDL